MTLREIMELSIRLLSEDVDEETISDYMPLLKSVINDAYIDICRYKYVPVKKEDITLNEGAFNTSALSMSLNEILEIKLNDKELPFRVEDGICTVFSKTNETVSVKYSYIPNKLNKDSDTPIFASQYHSCLADYAVYRLLGMGTTARQSRALFFYDIYLNRANKIERMEKSEKIKNKYD